MCCLQAVSWVRLKHLACCPGVGEGLLVVPSHPAQDARTRTVSKHDSCCLAQHGGIAGCAKRTHRSRAHQLPDKDMTDRRVVTSFVGGNEQVAIPPSADQLLAVALKALE